MDTIGAALFVYDAFEWLSRVWIDEVSHEQVVMRETFSRDYGHLM